MSSDSNSQRRNPSRQNFLRLSGATLLAATSLFLLAGCGGGGGSSTGGGSTGGGSTGGESTTALLPAGSYQGVLVTTSGPFSPDAGTVAFTVSSTGVISGSSLDYAGDGSTTNISGTVSSSGALVLNVASGIIAENATTHVFSTSYTQSNGSKGMLNAGLAPTASPLAGSYSGTISSTGGQGTAALTISSGGTVTGTATQGGQSAPLSGYVDASGNVYLVYKSTTSGLPSISVGSFTLNGASLNGTVQETQADGSSTSITVTLTKQ